MIDGVDNIPLDYMRILYGIEPNKMISFGNKKNYTNVKDVVLDSAKNKLDYFKTYQDAMIRAIDEAIRCARKYNFNHLPFNFLNNNSKAIESPFQYLLPIDFTRTGNPDFCACVSVDTNGTGRLKTILNMNEVYGNVRVFGMDAVESVKDWWV